MARLPKPSFGLSPQDLVGLEQMSLNIRTPAIELPQGQRYPGSRRPLPGRYNPAVAHEQLQQLAPSGTQTGPAQDFPTPLPTPATQPKIPPRSQAVIDRYRTSAGLRGAQDELAKSNIFGGGVHNLARALAGYNRGTGEYDEDARQKNLDTTSKKYFRNINGKDVEVTPERAEKVVTYQLDATGNEVAVDSAPMESEGYFNDRELGRELEAIDARREESNTATNILNAYSKVNTEDLWNRAGGVWGGAALDEYIAPLFAFLGEEDAQNHMNAIQAIKRGDLWFQLSESAALKPVSPDELQALKIAGVDEASTIEQIEAYINYHMAQQETILDRNEALDALYINRNNMSKEDYLTAQKKLEGNRFGDTDVLAVTVSLNDSPEQAADKILARLDKVKSEVRPGEMMMVQDEDSLGTIRVPDDFDMWDETDGDILREAFKQSLIEEASYGG